MSPADTVTTSCVGVDEQATGGVDLCCGADDFAITRQDGPHPGTQGEAARAVVLDQLRVGAVRVLPVLDSGGQLAQDRRGQHVAVEHRGAQHLQ